MKEARILRASFISTVAFGDEDLLIAQGAIGVDKFVGNKFGRTECARRVQTREGLDQSRGTASKLGMRFD